MSFDELDMKQQAMNQARGSVLPIREVGLRIALPGGLTQGLLVFSLFSFVDLCL